MSLKIYLKEKGNDQQIYFFTHFLKKLWNLTAAPGMKTQQSAEYEWCNDLESGRRPEQNGKKWKGLAETLWQMAWKQMFMVLIQGFIIYRLSSVLDNYVLHNLCLVARATQWSDFDMRLITKLATKSSSARGPDNGWSQCKSTSSNCSSRWAFLLLWPVCSCCYHWKLIRRSPPLKFFHLFCWDLINIMPAVIGTSSVLHLVYSPRLAM